MDRTYSDAVHRKDFVQAKDQFTRLVLQRGLVIDLAKVKLNMPDAAEQSYYCTSVAERIRHIRNQ